MVAKKTKNKDEVNEKAWKEWKVNSKKNNELYEKYYKKLHGSASQQVKSTQKRAEISQKMKDIGKKKDREKHSTIFFQPLRTNDDMDVKVKKDWKKRCGKLWKYWTYVGSSGAWDEQWTGPPKTGKIAIRHLKEALKENGLHKWPVANTYYTFETLRKQNIL